MPADDSPGHLGHLTADEEAKLRQLWAAVLEVFGVPDPNVPEPSSPEETAHPEHTDTDPSSKDSKKSKKRFGLFSRSQKNSVSSAATDGSLTSTTSSKPPKSPNPSTDENDKYGQTAEFQHTLSTQTPEELRTAFWSMVKKDHPDTLLLRFLRARKWDVQRALVMLISTMHWRLKDVRVDDDIMLRGERGAVEDAKSASLSATEKKEAEDFMQQLRMGKSFMHGADKQGRPICLVRVRLHKGGEQSETSIERFTVYTIETARLLLRPPVETACIIFDMTHFTLANMDYAPVKFMIKCFEANYPESLGAVLVHKAPWIFQGIWKIIRGWLDPVVAAKVHFTNSMGDLEEFVPKNQILKELGGEEDWEYRYQEPREGEDEVLLNADKDSRKKELLEEREEQVRRFQHLTWEWIHHGDGAEAARPKEQRAELAVAFRDGYWRLDPFLRARSWYDRTGMIGKGGEVAFYPGTGTGASAQSEGVGATTANGGAEGKKDKDEKGNGALVDGVNGLKLKVETKESDVD